MALQVGLSQYHNTSSVYTLPRMHKQMDLLVAWKNIHLPNWGFYTHLTVNKYFWNHCRCWLSVYRNGRVCSSTCRYPVLALPSLVVLLPYLSWDRYHQCRYPHRSVPVQITGWYDAIILYDTVRLISETEVYAESGQEAGEVGTAKGSKYRQILGLKTVHVLAFFLLVYVGTEVSGSVWFPGVSIVCALAQVTIGGMWMSRPSRLPLQPFVLTDLRNQGG